MTTGKLIMGLIPCQNQFLLNAVAPVIMPGLSELVEKSAGEFSVFQVMTDILYGSKQLHMAYIDSTETANEDHFQAQFAAMLQTPSKDFVGFTLIEPLRNDGFHIFAVWVKPEYQGGNMFQLGLAYLEKQALKMGAPYISLATRHDVSGALERFGFVETTSNYRKKLKE